MALIKSISGIRGTIGGKPGEGLTPLDIVKFAAAFGSYLKRRHGKNNISVVIGRDGRKSGPMVNALITRTLTGMGINVTDLGMATTPTVEIAVTGIKADGGIIITASHNPAEWNALKLLNETGEFLSSGEGNTILEIAASEDFEFSPVSSFGTLSDDDSWRKKHIESILALKAVNADAIKKAGFTIAVDCVNSVGGIIIPDLLTALGVKKVHKLNCTPDGNFAHNPEPLPAHLKDISGFVVKTGSDLGFVVDPDVDRLAVICEDGSMFGEEYTLVSVADYILGLTPGNTVSNLSSSKALADIAAIHGGNHFSAPVGEVNVVEEMKRVNAVIGGEGNGGVIYPALHYGRDALAGIALFLSLLATKRMKVSELRKTYPGYVISKNKMNLPAGVGFDLIRKTVKEHFKGYKTDERDGLWLGNSEGWVQVRKSNTEPVLRIYAEGRTEAVADELAERIIQIVKKI
jgi:phosphomannomutase